MSGNGHSRKFSSEMDDDIYTADGQPHKPPSVPDQGGSDPGGSDPGGSNGYLNANNPPTHFSKALPNRPPVLQAPNQTYTDTENVSQGEARDTDGDGDGRYTLIPEIRTSPDLLISSVP